MDYLQQTEVKSNITLPFRRRTQKYRRGIDEIGGNTKAKQINSQPMKNLLQPRANYIEIHQACDWLGVIQGDLLLPLSFIQLDKRRLFNNIIFVQVFLNKRRPCK